MPVGMIGRVALCVCLFVSGTVPVSQAQSQRISVVRDQEIENLLREYSAPLFGAAGIGSRGAQIILVGDRSFNAFVASGSRMFINSGTLLEAKTPNEVIGVLAHETGHLAGGHLQGLRNEMARAQAIGLLTSLLGAAAMVAGASAGSESAAQAGAAATSIGPGVASRTLLSYRRAQESAADRAALTYLNATGQSAQGMITTFRKFADQMLISSRFIDPYVQSHPMPTQRIAQLENAAQKSKYWDVKDPAKRQARHDLMRAKLSGYMEGRGRVARRYPRKDNSLAARYARAIVAYRSGSSRGAIRQIDALIKSAPDYPFFHELKGQALLESGKAEKAIPPLKRAVALAPNSGLIRILLGHAQLETGNDANLKAAISNLRTGLNEEPLASIGYRHLATALARQDRIPEAELATAQGHFIEGNIQTAKNYAKRAQSKLKRGSPGWLQADDILAYKIPKSLQRKRR